MVRQWRFGVAEPTLELPGGVVEDPTTRRRRRARELREETGFHARSLRPLGESRPTRRSSPTAASTFLATGLERVGEPSDDPLEEQVVELVPLADVPARVRRGEIRHALIVAAFHLLAIADPPAPPGAPG